MSNKSIKYIVAIIICIFLTTTNYSYCAVQSNTKAKSKFSWLHRNQAVKLKKGKKKKNIVEEIVLPPVIQGKPKIPFSQMPVMSIDDCVNYALSHNPNILISKERVEAAKAGIGLARANYAPRFSAGIDYYHRNTKAARVGNSQDNSLVFNVGVSEMIWDFGRTTARINMAKYDTQSAEFDHAFEVIDLIYNVKINYYKVLSALANLDIYEQNVRIQSLNHERTKAMFDEGLKSKIDVVNAEVKLADAKIQLIEGQNTLINSIIALQDIMFYQESKPFIVENTENFGFLKADYKKKMENAEEQKPSAPKIKRSEDGLILLSSGIEHDDILQGYTLNPMKLTKQEAVDKAFELRPDLKSFEMLVNVQNESLKSIRRQYAPQIDAGLNWSYTKNEGSYTSPLQLNAGIGIGSINPYGIHYQIKEGENYLNIAKHNVNILKSSIYWEVQDNYVNMRQLERKIPLVNTKVKASLENFLLADGRYSVGLNNYVELQDALTNYNNAQLNFVEAVLKYNISRETLIRSMGIAQQELDMSKEL